MQSPKSDSEVPSNRVIFSARMSALEFHVLTRVVPLETHLIIYPEMSDHSTHRPRPTQRSLNVGLIRNAKSLVALRRLMSD